MEDKVHRNHAYIGPENVDSHMTTDGSKEGDTATISGNTNSVYEVLAKATDNRKRITDNLETTTHKLQTTASTYDKALIIMFHCGTDGPHGPSHCGIGHPSYYLGAAVVRHRNLGDYCIGTWLEYPGM